jgi:hypothetical protein
VLSIASAACLNQRRICFIPLDSSTNMDSRILGAEFAVLGAEIAPTRAALSTFSVFPDQVPTARS